MTHSTSKSAPNSLDIWLGVATVPLLGGILMGRAIAKFLTTLGESSEELFRGDRLPIVTPPNPAEAPDSSGD